MREIVRPLAVALGVAAMMAILSSARLRPGQAGAETGPGSGRQATARAAAQEAPMKQIALTEKQVEGVLATAKDIEAITAKIPANAKPDPKVDAQLDAAAKKNGFASYAEYTDVTDNINTAMGGYRPGHQAVRRRRGALKAQIGSRP